MTLVSNPREQSERNYAEHRLNDVRESGARKTIDDSADRRPHDRAELPERRPPCDGVRVRLAGYDLSTESGPRRLQEAARQAADEHHGVDRPNGSSQHSSGVHSQDEECDRAPDLDRNCNQRDQLAVVPVGEVPGVEGRTYVRQRLSEANQSERERVFRESVHLPRHNRRLDLRSECQRYQARDAPQEISIAE